MKYCWHLISQNQSSNSNSYLYRIKLESYYGLLTVNKCNTLRSYFSEQRLNHNDKNQLLLCTTSTFCMQLRCSRTHKNTVAWQGESIQGYFSCIQICYKCPSMRDSKTLARNNCNIFIFVNIARKNNNVFIRVRSLPYEERRRNSCQAAFFGVVFSIEKIIYIAKQLI